MFDTVTEKLLIIVGTFVLTAALTLSLLQVVPEANAKDEPAVKAAQTAQPKGRIDVAACSKKSWPHYDAHCLTDYRAPGAEAAKPVRVISLR